MKKIKKVQVEFVSVNPTGKLHLGHIRGAVIGSTISNVLESQNFLLQGNITLMMPGIKLIYFANQ